MTTHESGYGGGGFRLDSHLRIYSSPVLHTVARLSEVDTSSKSRTRERESNEEKQEKDDYIGLLQTSFCMYSYYNSFRSKRRTSLSAWEE
jgi:hypothetical protein